MADSLAGLEQRARHMRELHAGAAATSVLVSAAEYAAASYPAPVFWRDTPAAHDDSTDVDAVLSVGEVQGLPCQPARFAAQAAVIAFRF